MFQLMAYLKKKKNPSTRILMEIEVFIRRRIFIWNRQISNTFITTSQNVISHDKMAIGEAQTFSINRSKWM